MLSISKRTDYGLLLLSFFAKLKPKQFASINAIAKENNLPYKYLSQIASDLKTSGFLTSKEGAKGGYRLKIPPQKLMLNQVIEVLEGELLISCSTSRSCYCNQACLHKEVMEKVIGGIQDYSLADLIKKKSCAK